MRTTNINYFLLLFLFLITACSPNHKRPIQGVLDLRNNENAAIESHTLGGQWEFYWNQLLTPQDFKQDQQLEPLYVEVPSSWTTYKDKNGNNIPVYGYATYRLKILLPRKHEDIGLYIPKIWSANKVWVNDKLIAQTGIISTSREGYEDKVLEKLAHIEIDSGVIELIVQVSNYDLFISGLIRDFSFGEHQHLYTKKAFDNTWNLMWLGCIFLMALYHFILFYFRKKRKSTYYFALICLLIAVRSIVFGEHFIYEYLKEHWGWLTFAIQSKTYYITTFMLLPVGLLYARSLYPKETNDKLIKISLFASGGYSLFLLIMPPSIFSPTILPAQVIPIISAIYLLFILILAVIRKRSESFIQVTGIFIMILAGINDALHSQGIDLVGDDELIPASLGVFLLLQIFIIAKRFSRAFNEVEDLSINLEKKVIQRTIEVTNQKEEIEAQKEAIEKKSDQLEYAYTQITDSVKYARKIQNAILGSQKEIIDKLKEAFILFEPKDIVSGDFYWYFEQKNWKILVAADCTGHGVPGAFMTVMGSNFLHEIVSDKKVMKPCKILHDLDEKVSSTLAKKSEHSTNDGMDMSVVCINENNKKLVFAGAKNPLYIVRKNENNDPTIHEIKGSKFPIGSDQFKGLKKDFESHTIDYHEDDTFYIFSDGYQDQFGGPDDRKYMRKRFRNKILELSQKPMEEQKSELLNELNSWKGNKKQTDDILVMGFKV